MKVLFICSIIVIITACANQTNTEFSDNSTAALDAPLTTPTHNATSTFSIKGMTCEIGCVRTVKSHLSKMNGVLDIEMNFDTSRTIDFSVVKFDQSLVSENEMKTEIESIANGIYTVIDVTNELK